MDEDIPQALCRALREAQIQRDVRGLDVAGAPAGLHIAHLDLPRALANRALRRGQHRPRHLIQLRAIPCVYGLLACQHVRVLPDGELQRVSLSLRLGATNAIAQAQRQLLSKIGQLVAVGIGHGRMAGLLGELLLNPILAAEHKAGDLLVAHAQRRVDANRPALRRHAQIEILDALLGYAYVISPDFLARGLRHDIPPLVSPRRARVCRASWSLFILLHCITPESGASIERRLLFCVCFLRLCGIAQAKQAD